MSTIPRRPAILCLLVALLGAFPVSAAALAPRASGGLLARPASIVAGASAADRWDVRPLAKPAGRPDGLVSVIVKLGDAPLAAYAGGLPGLPATAPQASGARRLDAGAPASQQYLRYLDQRQADFAMRAQAAIPQARLVARYRTVFGGVAMIVPDGEVDRLAALPGVLWVERDQLRQADTDRSPGFIGADVIWRALAADPSLGDGGEGVIVGVIDTGIWPEHPSFADDGSYPPPPARWHGACEQPGDTSPPIACSNKLIGARTSLDLYKLLFGLEAGEFDSARDNEGHGTHTASTAAGNADVPATVLGQPRGLVSGIAPRAHIAAYKALGNQGGFGADLVAAIDQAVADGVDIINYSIGSLGLPPSPYQAADSLAFLDAYRAGVFVAVSAGNAGPDQGTVSSPANAPWVMSVAASTTDRRFVGQLALRAGADTLALEGASITGGVAGRPVVDAARLGLPLCDGPLPAAARGAIVICRRGGNGRVEKSNNVFGAGGVGMVLYNPFPQDVVSDNHWVPTVHLDAPAAEQLLAFTSAHSGTAILGDITAGQPSTDPAFGDIVASFSARGPLPEGQRGVGKPDIAAPGVQILAGHTPAPNLVAEGPRGELFQAIAGTSMAAPHLAGAGALLKALHPGWTPGQIKSALMTTALAELRDSDGLTPTTPDAIGSGRVDLRYAGDPGLTLDVTADEFAQGPAQLARLNYPSISIPIMPGQISVARTVTSVLDTPSQWQITAEAPAGVQIDVEPPLLQVPARASATFTVTIEAAAPPGRYFGRVLLQSGERRLHLPISFTRDQPAVALEQRCDPNPVIRRGDMQCAIVATNNGVADANISLRSRFAPGLSVRDGTLTGATYDRESRLMQYDGTLPSFKPATIAISRTLTGLPWGYVPLASLGIAPSPCEGQCDETAITFIAPPFSYNGQQYDRVTMVANGYVIVGGDRTIRLINHALPDEDPPHNMIAPYWADLDLRGTAANDTGGGTWSAAYVSNTAGDTSWFVAEWTDVARYGRSPDLSRHSFQVWIQAGSGQVHIAYGPNSPLEDRLTVGAENADSTIGGTYYFDGTTGDGPNGNGTPPAEGDVLSVTSVPEQRSDHAITFVLRGKRAGSYLQRVELTADTFDGVNVSILPIEVVLPEP